MEISTIVVSTSFIKENKSKSLLLSLKTSKIRQELSDFKPVEMKGYLCPRSRKPNPSPMAWVGSSLSSEEKLDEFINSRIGISHSLFDENTYHLYLDDKELLFTVENNKIC